MSNVPLCLFFLFSSRCVWRYSTSKGVSLLTVLAVIGDLHLALVGPQESLSHLGDGVPVGELSVEEVAGARLLHHIRPGETGHLAKAVVAVDDRAVLHPGVGYNELLIYEEKDRTLSH